MSDSLTVVYVDPDRVARDQLTAAFEDRGADVLAVEDTMACLKRLETHEVDCIVAAEAADLNSSDMLPLITEAAPTIPVLIIGRPRMPLPPGNPEYSTVGTVPSDADIVSVVRETVRRQDLAHTLNQHRDLVQAVAAVARAVIGADSRTVIEQRLYEHLSSVDLFDTVWIARANREENTFSIVVPIEVTHPLEHLAAFLGTPDAAFVQEAIAEDRVTVSRTSMSQQSQATSISDGQPKVAVVPFAPMPESTAFALLTSTRPDAFDESERDVLTVLGHLVGMALLDHVEELDPIEFSEVIVHELMNPLSVARLRVETARDTGDLGHLDRIADALDRIEHLLRDELALLDREDVGETQLRELSESAREAWEGISTTDATLAIEDSTEIIANHRLLTQLFANLFDNAIKHGSVDATVRVGTLSDGFYVEDNGPGIPAEKRRRVFERGYSTAAGTGLGLAVVERIANAHDWTVTITESDEGGARIEIRGVATNWQQ